MNEAYYIGEYRDDAVNGQNRGWILGKFMENAPRKNEVVEVKYWEYKAGQAVNHGIKTSKTLECTLLLKGKTTCLIDNVETTLHAGHYIVI